MNTESHNHKSTVPGQMSLNELLDQIERLHGEEWSVTRESGFNVALRNAVGRAMLVGPMRHEPAFKDVAANHNVAPYVPALVKALRVAVDSLEIEMLDSPVQAVRTFAKSALQEIAQLLSADSGSTVSEKKDLEIKDA